MEFSYISGNGNPKKLLIFQEVTFQAQNIKNPSRENFLYFRIPKAPKNFLYFLKRKLFIYFRKRKPRKNSLFFRKRNFLKFAESYIQNTSIFRTKSVFRILVYSQPEAYSEHCQTSTMKRFVKQLPTSALSYIPGNEAFSINISLIFQEATFRARKVKRTQS